jgi:hypothetical protein
MISFSGAESGSILDGTSPLYMERWSAFMQHERSVRAINETVPVTLKMFIATIMVGDRPSRC